MEANDNRFLLISQRITKTAQPTTCTQSSAPDIESAAVWSRSSRSQKSTHALQQSPKFSTTSANKSQHKAGASPLLQRKSEVATAFFYPEVLGGLKTMVDRNQLQQHAREVEALRKRFDEINLRLEQVDTVLAEHAITTSVLSALTAPSDKASVSTHLPIGSGVSLPYRHVGSKEGTALVDLGAGVFGERPWSDAHAITDQRRQDIQQLRDELKGQADQTEASLAEVAQKFNTLAETLQAQATPSPPASPTLSPEEVEKPEQDQPSQRRQRKRGMFGNDLTLDD